MKQCLSIQIKYSLIHVVLLCQGKSQSSYHTLNHHLQTVNLFRLLIFNIERHIVSS